MDDFVEEGAAYSLTAPDAIVTVLYKYNPRPLRAFLELSNGKVELERPADLSLIIRRERRIVSEPQMFPRLIHSRG